jgi:DNA-directed RNA polymerase specialized sigma24 family protein
MKKCTDSCLLSSILVNAQRGDRAAQAELAGLVMTALKPVIALASRGVPPADQEDVRQATFLLLINPRLPFNPNHERANARSYCFHAARSAANSRVRVRSKARRADADPDQLVEPVETPPAEVRDELRAAHAVDATLFEVVSAVALEGATAKEAGRRFGLAPSKVCRALQEYAARCRANLRRSA